MNYLTQPTISNPPSKSVLNSSLQPPRFTQNLPPIQPIPSHHPRPTSATTVPAVATEKPSGPTFKRLSEAEFQAKNEKGLCFKCDEKYSIGHKCQNKELQVMVILDEKILEEIEDVGKDSQKMEMN